MIEFSWTQSNMAGTYDIQPFGAAYESGLANWWIRGQAKWWICIEELGCASRSNLIGFFKAWAGKLE